MFWIYWFHLMGNGVRQCIGGFGICVKIVI